jgi:hypothetical protein
MTVLYGKSIWEKNEKHSNYLPRRYAKGAFVLPRQKRGTEPKLFYREPVAAAKGEK